MLIYVGSNTNPSIIKNVFGEYATAMIDLIRLGAESH